MKPNIVLIGVGRFGKNHLRNLLNLQNKNKLNLLGIIDSNKKLAQELGEEYGVRYSTKVNEFLDESDAYDIVSPGTTHYKLAKYFLERSKHVFVEKPLSMKYNDAKKLVKLAAEKKCILQVGHIFRFNSAVNILRDRINNGKNKPFYITGDFLQQTKPSFDIGAIFNYLHHFDILHNLMNQNPKRIFTIENLGLTNPSREINATVFLQYPQCNVKLNLGWVPSGKSRTLEIFTITERISVDLLTQKIEIFKNGKLSKVISPKFNEPLELELKEFVKCINSQKTPIADGKIGADIVKIAEMATRSLRTKKVVRL